jgi:hypothetical protein
MSRGWAKAWPLFVDCNDVAGVYSTILLGLPCESAGV